MNVSPNNDACCLICTVRFENLHGSICEFISKKDNNKIFDHVCVTLVCYLYEKEKPIDYSDNREKSDVWIQICIRNTLAHMDRQNGAECEGVWQGD